MFTVWIEDECRHSERILCRCTNRRAAEAVAKWVSASRNLHADVESPERW